LCVFNSKYAWVYLKSFSIILVVFGDRDICFRKMSDLLEGCGQPEVPAHRDMDRLYALPAAGHQEFKDFLNWRTHFNHQLETNARLFLKPLCIFGLYEMLWQHTCACPVRKGPLSAQACSLKFGPLILASQQTPPNKTSEPLLKPFPAPVLEALFNHP